MLQTVTIQNFKSLKDVTVRLQKVNLLIGPNNSGKSNFLKSLTQLKEFYNYRIQPTLFDFSRIYHQQETKNSLFNREPITFAFKWDAKNFKDSDKRIYKLELLGYNAHNNVSYNEAFGTFKGSVENSFRVVDLDYVYKKFQYFFCVYNGEKPLYTPDQKFTNVSKFYSNRADRSLLLLLENKVFNALDWQNSQGTLLENVVALNGFLDLDLKAMFNGMKIYKPDPSRITRENLLLFDKQVNEDCSNLVAFLDNMRDGHEDVWQAIQRDLNKCIPDFVGINFEKVKVNNSENLGKKFGLRDKKGKTYWADELSEGTIYFLALLAIVHQPNPPKVLLLEEPEKGIHPRRISEVMDLIFRLAEEKDIQIILTTHSTQVVDEFQDIPESVFVFDIQDGETKVKNLLTDIIEPDNEKADNKGYPKLDFNKHTLGEHWAIGFLGGVPAR